MGDIGFRELHYFNVAMLAKQFWIILHQPKSLVAQILKAKYFRRNELLQAQLGFKPSYLWRSLLAARDLVLHGSAWRVGNGKEISIRNDRWVGVEDPQVIEQINLMEFQPTRVSELIDAENGDWKNEMVESIFNPTDATKILQIPLSQQLPEDRRVWRFDKKRRFRVRSGYHAAVQMYSSTTVRRSSASTVNVGWKKLWNIKTLPRVKMFLWKACTKSLPTRINLAKRGCIDDVICGVRGEDSETIGHLLLHCRSATMVWYGCPLRINITHEGFHSFNDLIFENGVRNKPEYMSLLAYTAWEIWNHRNKNYFDNKPFVISEVIQCAENRWREDMDSWAPGARPRSRKKDNPRWKQLDPGVFKLNTDVAANQMGKEGLGFVVRGHGGNVELAGKCEVNAEGRSDLLEGIAIRYGLQMARRYHLRVNTVECDNSGIVDDINGKATLSLYCDILVHDIIQMMREVGCRKVNHIPRLANQVAHEIARGPIFLSIRQIPKHVTDAIQNDVID